MVSGGEPKPEVERAAVVGLSDSEVIGSWSASYNDYNCYGYAIRTYETRTPGNYSGANPGGYSISMTASILADYTIKDLEVKGYNAYKNMSGAWNHPFLVGMYNQTCDIVAANDPLYPLFSFWYDVGLYEKLNIFP